MLRTRGLLRPQGPGGSLVRSAQSLNAPWRSVKSFPPPGPCAYCVELCPYCVGRAVEGSHWTRPHERPERRGRGV